MLPEFRSPVETLTEGMAFIGRRRLIISVTCFVALVLALLYIVTAVPVFTARAELVIVSKVPGDAASVSTLAESQIAIIRSEAIARAVLQKLGLAEDPEFAAQGVVSQTIGAISRLLGWRKPEAEASVSRRAIDAFERKLSVKRVGVTYILEMTFDSVDPERAAHILNTISETYISAQMDDRYRWSPQSEKWFKDRTSELSNQASAAKNAVAAYYKSKTDIADSSGAVDAATAPSQLTPSTQGELRELEATAEAATRTYDNFLRVQRYMEITQQQSSPTFEARLIEVTRPLVASSPKAKLLLGMATVGGVLLGIAIGLLRDLSDRGILTSADRTAVSSVVALQQGELANENYTPAAFSPLRHQNPRDEPGTLAAGTRRSPDA